MAKTERGEVQRILRGLKAEGWYPARVADGEGVVARAGKPLPYMGEAETLEAIMSVEMCNVLMVKYVKGEKVGHIILIVLGNSPEEVVADWGFADGDPDGFDALMDKLTGEQA